MMHARITEPQAIHVIVLREVLIARDIEMTIRECRPDAQVILCTDPRQAAEVLPTGRIEAVFLQSDGEVTASSALTQRVAADGGRTILVGAEAGAALPPGWFVLPFPFASKDIIEILTDILQGLRAANG